MSRLKKSISQKLRATGIGATSLPRSVVLQGRKLIATPIQEVSERLSVEAGQKIQIVVESFSSEEQQGSALFELRFLDRSGERIAIPGWANRSARVGDYFYLTPGDQKAPSIDSIVVTAPSQAATLELVGHQWKQAVNTSVVGRVVLYSGGKGEHVAETPSGVPIKRRAEMLVNEFCIPDGTDRVQVSVRHIAEGKPSSGPVQVELYDADGKLLTPVGNLQQHPSFGPFFTLKGDPGKETKTDVTIEIPSGAALLKLIGKDWGGKTAFVIGDVEFDATGDGANAIGLFLESVPPAKPLLLIDTTAPPLGHETLALRPNNMTAAYARAGYAVIFIPFGSLQDQDARHGESIMQVPRLQFDALTQLLLKFRDGCENVYICSSFPSLQAVTAANLFKTKGWKVVYEARDDMEEFNRVGYSKWYSPLLEKTMLRTADKVISVSSALDEKLKSMLVELSAEFAVIPNAVNEWVIRNGEPLRTSGAFESRAASSIVGYVGHLTPSWFDWELLVRAAERRPEVTFEVVGHGMPEGLDLPDNILYLGPKTHEELPDIVSRWRAGLIPFLNMPLTRSVDPNKIYEYFAWGLPCVSAPMGMVDEYPWTTVYENEDEFVEAIDQYISKPITEQDIDELERFLEHANWDTRARSCAEFIGINDCSEG